MQLEMAYDERIRRGLIPWKKAEAMIAEQARFIRFDAWQLNVDPIDHPILSRMGIRKPINIRHKFLHVFPTLLNGEGRDLMAIHTMPIDKANPHCPGTMGGKDSKIRIFAMTPDASQARFEQDQHRVLPATVAMPIRHPAERAHLIACFAANIKELDLDYTVPVQPVRDQFIKALLDPKTLCPNLFGRQSDRFRRRAALRKLKSCTNEGLAAELNKQTHYRMGADGNNSNSGARALCELFDAGPLPYTNEDAPFIGNSLLAFMPELQNELIQVNNIQLSRLPQPPARNFAQRLLGRFGHHASAQQHAA